MLLEVAQMVGHHGYVSAPFLFQTDEDTHSDGVHSGLSHAVETVAAPVEIGLHSARMVNVVMCSVISLLEADYTIHSVLGEFCVIFC